MQLVNHKECRISSIAGINLVLEMLHFHWRRLAAPPNPKPVTRYLAPRMIRVMYETHN